MSEWNFNMDEAPIAWSGGHCPVNPYLAIIPTYRDPLRHDDNRPSIAPAGKLHWEHDGGPDDIVAYKETPWSYMPPSALLRRLSSLLSPSPPKET